MNQDGSVCQQSRKGAGEANVRSPPGLQSSVRPVRATGDSVPERNVTVIIVLGEESLASISNVLELRGTEI